MSDTPKTAARKVTEENFSKLKEKLRELFQLDRGDLDFGLYRIMAHKSVEVDKFLKNDLLPQVAQALGKIAASDSETAQKELDEAILKAREVGGVDPEQTDVVKNARVKLAAAKTDQQTEADTYNHLYNFFSRYYDEGDFMSLRRYKGAGKEAYSIPYNGEEVKLHWANSDQYYIKTTENYCSYIFIPGDNKLRVRFEIAKADNEKDNIKEANGKQRFFVLSKDYIAEEKNQLVVRFEHRPLTGGEKTAHPQNGIRRQASINKDAGQRILTKLEKAKGDWRRLLSAPCPTEADPERTLLDKHIAVYTAKNSFDYFIHKDLGGFLRRELDTYIKGEVISVDNLELNDDPTVFIRSLAQVKAIRSVGHKIIDFLAQLENFQKQLWLKKKFVLETQYCVTLDKVPETLYPAIVKNRAQHDEWVKLFAIDELDGADGATAYSKALKPQFLKENPYLVLDTRHFDQKFTDELLAGLSEAEPIDEQSKARTIDEQMNGLLVHGENFQALRLLQERYREQVKCVYIDPPYNTDMSPILYKNDYRHSSWMSLIEQGLHLSKEYLNNKGVLSVAVDDEEAYRLKMLMDGILGADRYIGTVSIQSNPGGRDINTHFATSHDYCVFYANPGQKEMFLPRDIEEGSEQVGGFRRTGGLSSPMERENSEFAFYYDPDDLVILGVGGKRTTAYPAEYEPVFILCLASSENVVEMSPTDFYAENPKAREILPKFRNGDRGVWRWSDRRKILAAVQQGNIFLQRSSHSDVVVKIKSLVKPKYKPKTIWADSIYSGTTYGTILLQNIFGVKSEFSYPKSIYATKTAVEVATYEEAEAEAFVVDYFAGSGTTGHAVIELNRKDNENRNRKYVLVEIGHHFESVMLPRLKKVVYSEKWKDGKPEDRNGISQLFKYIRLESYEDSLDSLAVKSRNDLFIGEDKGIVEDYQLRYALGEETADSASLVGQDFIDPFNYTLSVVRDGVRQDVNVDLAETFNFLLGLRLTSRQQMNGVLAVTGTTRKGENCLILWRNLNKMDASQLDKWFTKHRQTFGNNLNLIYVNGDHTLNALRESGDKWEAITTEPVFRQLMFNGAE